ncbi:MAG: glycosyltransferase [bacterium]|nr:glycosyltransferase [bacterium]
MRIALIFPSYEPKIFSENLRTVDEEFCLAPPIILAYVAAILEQHGHEVVLLDTRALSLTKKDALKQLEEFKPHMLGFRSETYHFHDSLEWVRYLKSRLNVPVFTGGVNMTLYPVETLMNDEIDYGIIGESIESLPQFLCALENDEDFTAIPGLGYKTGTGEIRMNSPSEKVIDFDSYPFPARHLLPNDKYHSFISQRKNFTIILTSTGCPFQCSFCAIPSAYRARSPESVIEEIKTCYYDFGVREIEFFDAVLFMPRKRILELLRQLRELDLDIEWACRARVDVVDEEILREAAAAGCRQIYYGIESVDQEVLNGVKKEIVPGKVREAIALTKKFGIRAMGFFMIGNAGDSRETVMRSVRFAKELDLDFIQVCRTIAKPGTELDQSVIKETGIDFWRDHVLGFKIDERIPAPWAELTEKEKASLVKEFYFRFYFRPKIIFRRLRQLKAFNELLRYVRVAVKMIINRSRLYSYVQTDTAEAEMYLKRSSLFLPDARQKKTAVIIPTYNEKDVIEKTVAGVAAMLPEAYIIIVDDNSPDGTAEAANAMSEQYPRVRCIHRKGERGLGLAYKEAFKFVLAQYDVDYIFEMDADLSHNPEYMPLFLHYAQYYNLVTGSRFLKRVSIKNRGVWRNVQSKLTKWCVNKLIGINLSDVTTGYKCYQRSFLESIDLDAIVSKGFAFQIECSYYVKRAGGSIKEIPIFFVERTVGESKMSGKIFLEGVALIGKLTWKRLFRKQ